MNKITLFSTVLFAAFLLTACNKNEETKNEVLTVPECATPDSKLPIAFVNLDTIISQYNVAIEANEKLIKKQEDARLSINEKAQKWQAEVNEFNRKLENNAFLSRERAEKEAQRLQKKESELQSLEQKLTQELLEEQQKMTLQLRTAIDNAIKEFNKDGRYHLILSTSAMQETVIFSLNGYDISADILALLNKVEE